MVALMLMSGHKNKSVNKLFCFSLVKACLDFMCLGRLSRCYKCKIVESNDFSLI